jgi:hypothetical protein
MNYMSAKVLALDENAARNATELSRVVALRWDLVPWGLVLDIDCSELPDGAGAIRRCWLIFSGISELSWSLRNTRLPNGVMTTGPIGRTAIENGFVKYTIHHLAPTCSEHGNITGNPHNELVITAKGLSCLVSSSAIEAAGEWLDFEKRNDLASDADFLAIVKLKQMQRG